MVENSDHEDKNNKNLFRKDACSEGDSLLFPGGNYYYNARWYDPQLGRFITEGPARAGNNYYIYVSNNPLIYTDPLGLTAEEIGGDGTTVDPLKDLDVWIEAQNNKSIPQRIIDDILGTAPIPGAVIGTPTLLLSGPAAQKLLTATPLAFLKGTAVNTKNIVTKNPGSFALGFVEEFGPGLFTSGPSPSLPPATSQSQKIGRTTGKIDSKILSVVSKLIGN